MNDNSDFRLRIPERDVRLSDTDRIIPHSAFRIPHSKGFTLVEVLLAMAILAVVMTAIYAGFSAAGASVEHAEASRDSMDLGRTLMALMTRDIANAFCRSGMQGTFFFGKKEEVEIEGEKYRMDSLALTTLTNWRRPDSKETELWKVGYFFQEKPEGDGRVMMRHEQRIVGSEDLENVETTYEITDAVRSLQIRYWNGASWIDDRGSETKCDEPLPAEITLTLKDGTVLMTRADVVRGLN